MTNRDSSIRVGNVVGTGIAIGNDARAQGTYLASQEAGSEIAELLEQLKAEICGAPISDSAKHVLLDRAVPQMEKAMESDDPQSGLERGLERINDQIEGIGAAAKNVSGIAETATKIAQVAGLTMRTVAPFLAAMV